MGQICPPTDLTRPARYATVCDVEGKRPETGGVKMTFVPVFQVGDKVTYVLRDSGDNKDRQGTIIAVVASVVTTR